MAEQYVHVRRLVIGHYWPLQPGSTGATVTKYNTGTVRAPAGSPVTSTVTPAGRTCEGGPGYARDARSELYLLAVSALAGETRFYDRQDPRVNAIQVTPRRHVETARAFPRLTGIPWQDETTVEQRFRELVRAVALEDGGLDWLTGFSGWLRRDAFMRTGAVVVAAETIHARHAAGIKPFGREIIPSALDRADEPGELLAYWLSRYGRTIPHALKRGLSDAIERLYNEYAVLKYDSAERAIRFGDVIEMVSPRYHRRLYGTWRDTLYRYCVERRHNRANPVPSQLKTIRAHAELMAWPQELRRLFLDRSDAAARLKDAGVTWEALSGWLGGPMNAAAWQVIIPSMGVHALLKNLRNFDRAGISDQVAAQVTEALADPVRITSAKVLPMRFLSAQRAMVTQRWGHALDLGLSASVGNIPYLPGRTLILVDTSSSMNDAFSKDGELRRWDAAALFGIAIGQRCDYADVVSFSSTARYTNEPDNANTKIFPRIEGESLLRSLDRWRNGGYFLGGGTNTAAAVRRHFRDTFHSRVIIVTDEQASYNGPEVSACVPAQVPLYTWNLAGYQYGHTPSGSGTRHTFGGLSDASFNLIRLIEAGRDAKWDDLFARPNRKENRRSTGLTTTRVG